MQSLHRAAHYDVLPPIDEIIEDEWLEHLHDTAEFVEFLSQLER